jgi:type I site-specific restriction endonuclease
MARLRLPWWHGDAGLSGVGALSVVMMTVLEQQVASLTRQIEKLGPENEQVRALLTEFDHRHDRDQVKIEKLKDGLARIRDMNPTGTTMMRDGTWREAHRDLQRIARLLLQQLEKETP